MCGIAGVLGAREKVTEEGLLERLKDQLAHRGPDDDGIEIIDLAGSGRRALGLVRCRT